MDLEVKVTFWELRGGKEAESHITKTIQRDIVVMWQVLMYPVAICISSLFHEGVYWITSKWRLWNIKRPLLCGVAAAHSCIIMWHFDTQYNKDGQGEEKNNLVFPQTQTCEILGRMYVLTCLIQASDGSKESF